MTEVDRLKVVGAVVFNLFFLAACGGQVDYSRSVPVAQGFPGYGCYPTSTTEYRPTAMTLAKRGKATAVRVGGIPDTEMGRFEITSQIVRNKVISVAADKGAAGWFRTAFRLVHLPFVGNFLVSATPVDAWDDTGYTRVQAVIPADEVGYSFANQKGTTMLVAPEMADLLRAQLFQLEMSCPNNVTKPLGNTFFVR